MFLSFGLFLVLFLGGFWLMGIAHELEAMQGLVFVGGILLVSLALAFVMRAQGSDTRRSGAWSGGGAGTNERQGQ